MRTRTVRLGASACALAALLGLTAVGCGDDDAAPVPQGSMAVNIAFRGVVGSEPFSCTRSYSGIGAPPSTITPLDFRLFVSGIRLVTAAGAEVPVTLEQDGRWQYADVALIDFEDGSGTCANGTADTNTVVRGLAPRGPYRGLRFVLGVPFALNHINAATAPSPLNLTALWWNWNGGYKFLRADARTNGLPRFNVHLGSTGCEEDAQGAVTGCSRPNRAEVVFDQFDLARDAVYADFAELLAGVNIDTNQPDTAPGCMSAPNDQDCAGVFANLGISFATGAPDPGHQAFFRRGPR